MEKLEDYLPIDVTAVLQERERIFNVPNTCEFDLIGDLNLINNVNLPVVLRTFKLNNLPHWIIMFLKDATPPTPQESEDIVIKPVYTSERKLKVVSGEHEDKGQTAEEVLRKIGNGVISKSVAIAAMNEFSTQKATEARRQAIQECIELVDLWIPADPIYTKAYRRLISELEKLKK